MDTVLTIRDLFSSAELDFETGSRTTALGSVHEIVAGAATAMCEDAPTDAGAAADEPRVAFG